MQQLLPLRNSREILSNSARKNLKSVAPFGETDPTDELVPGRFGICDGSPAFKLIQVIGGSNLDSEGCGLCNKSAVFGRCFCDEGRNGRNIYVYVTLRFLYEFFFPQNSRREMGDLHQNMILFSANARFLEHTWFTGLELGIFE